MYECPDCGMLVDSHHDCTRTKCKTCGYFTLKKELRHLCSFHWVLSCPMWENTPTLHVHQVEGTDACDYCNQNRRILPLVMDLDRDDPDYLKKVFATFLREMDK